jgi:hypothetical protein
MKILRVPLVLILSALIVLLVCAGCGEEQRKNGVANEALKSRKLKTIEKCEDSGGIAVLSTWDGRLENCIYPPANSAN